MTPTTLAVSGEQADAIRNGEPCEYAAPFCRSFPTAPTVCIGCRGDGSRSPDVVTVTVDELPMVPCGRCDAKGVRRMRYEDVPCVYCSGRGTYELARGDSVVLVSEVDDYGGHGWMPLASGTVESVTHTDDGWEIAVTVEGVTDASR